jgi:hypothetical protein
MPAASEVLPFAIVGLISLAVLSYAVFKLWGDD